MLGFINVYKPAGMTSSRVVTSIKKKFHIDKIGHMGTLDPIAEGVLPLAVGKATRMFDYFLSKVKTYVVTFEFGYTTDTLDSAGVKTEESDVMPSMDKVLSSIKLMCGKSMQLPPKYSAKKVNGAKAYDLARAGVEFELKPKEIDISRFELLSYEDKKYSFVIECSSGTYIRAIGRDLADLIGTPVCMIKLVRVESGIFNTNNSIGFDSLMEKNSIKEFVMPVEAIFPSFNVVEVNDTEAKHLLNGRNVESKNSLLNHTFVKNNDKLLGVSKMGNANLFLDTHLRCEND
ncbi:MAG: tRNA pseudouridine(55) synthase TruB [Clostridia bacterium]|nr:tRNA pseudouridine(55) synthase TruB [Clostridia bacterium]